MAKLVIAEDEGILNVLLGQMVAVGGHCVLGAAYTGSEAIDLVANHLPEIVLLDMAMEDKEAGIRVCRHINEHQPEVKVIFVTAYPREVYEDELESLTYHAFLMKPIRPELLLRTLKEVAEIRV